MDASKTTVALLGKQVAVEKLSRWLADLVIASFVLKRLILPRLFRKRKSTKANNDPATPSSTTSDDAAAKAANPAKPKSGLVYPGFKQDLRYLINVCFSSWTCKEALMCQLFLLVLLSRTLLSLVTAEVDGYLVKQLINREKRSTVYGIMLWFGIAIPSSLINSLIKYLQNRIALALREKLNHHIQKLYFANDAFYKLSHHLVKLPKGNETTAAEEGGESASSPAAPAKKQARGKSVIQYPPNTEQAVTEGITQWSDRFADVISSLGKPLFDVALFLGVLIKVVGWRNELVATIAVWESGDLLRAVRPNFTKLVQERNHLESQFRGQYTRVVAHSEEIAFYGGEQRESGILAEQFRKILEFSKKTLRNQFVYSSFEEFLTKYIWSAIGIIQVAVPLLNSNTSTGDNAKYFISVRRVMTRAADAAERLLQGVRDVGELAGYTRNLMNTIDVLKYLNDNRDEQTKAMVESADDDHLEVQNVPLCTPTGDVLIESMNLALSNTDRLLILGPNGCGKSTLFRILCGLWTPQSGRIVKPKERTDLLFLPQRPYMIRATLIEQVVYPLSIADAESKRLALHPQSESLEALVIELLSYVSMRHIVEQYSVNKVHDWNAVLSGGEKQRLGLTRVFFHRPKYAILDECNSTLDATTEEDIFSRLAALQGVGLITISHRHTLFKYHSKFLTYDGVGGYTFHETTCDAEGGDDNVRAQLDTRATQKIRLVTLLMEVCKELGESWPSTPLLAQ